MQIPAMIPMMATETVATKFSLLITWNLVVNDPKKKVNLGKSLVLNVPRQMAWHQIF